MTSKMLYYIFDVTFYGTLSILSLTMTAIIDRFAFTNSWYALFWKCMIKRLSYGILHTCTKPYTSPWLIWAFGSLTFLPTIGVLSWYEAQYEKCSMMIFIHQNYKWTLMKALNYGPAIFHLWYDKLIFNLEYFHSRMTALIIFTIWKKGLKFQTFNYVVNLPENRVQIILFKLSPEKTIWIKYQVLFQRKQ